MLTRKLMVSKCDVKNPKPKSRAHGTSGYDVVPKGTIFAHEVCTDDINGGKTEEIVEIDEESLQPVEGHDSSSAFFKLMMPNLRRAKRGLARVLQENDIYAPTTVMRVFHSLIERGVVKLDDVEKEVKSFKAELDKDIDPGFEDQVTTPEAVVKKPKGMPDHLKKSLLKAVKKAGTMNPQSVIGVLPKKINSEDRGAIREFLSFCGDYDVILTAKNIDQQFRTYCEELTGV